MIQIRPVSDLRNKFPEIETLVNSGNPVYLTKNGYGAMVVLSLEEYISKKLRVQNCIIENKGNDFNFSKNENHMRNEKMERIINIEDSVIKHSHQDTVSHILVVHQWQVCLMHNLIRVWFSNSFLLPSSQCEAYSLHWYKHQCCFVRDYILQILFSSYLISLSFNQLFATKIRSISISSPCHFYFVLYCFI